MKRPDLNPMCLNIYAKQVELQLDTFRYFAIWAKQNSNMDKRSHDYKLLNWIMVF